MTIQNAIYFLNQLDNLSELRDALYRCDSLAGIRNILENAGFQFNLDEFENSVNMLHVRCQDIAEAEILLQKAQWFRMILSFAKPDATNMSEG